MPGVLRPRRRISRSLFSSPSEDRYSRQGASSLLRCRAAMLSAAIRSSKCSRVSFSCSGGMPLRFASSLRMERKLASCRLLSSKM